MLFFVKVRINLDQLTRFAQDLQNGSITTHPVNTWCLKDDPTVGLNIWEAESRQAFEAAFAPHKAFYSEIFEVTPVITAQESQKLLMEQLAAGTRQT